MDYTTWSLPPVTEPARRADSEANELRWGHGLYHALQALSDPRRKQGQRYEAAFLLCLLLLAKLAGQTTLSGATQWVRHRGQAIADHFGLKRTTMPCQMTSCRLLARLDAQHLDEVLAAFFIRREAEQRCGEEPSRLSTPQAARDHAHLAIDGKTVRATSHQPHQTHLLSCYDVTTGAVLWHGNVQEKQNEISALKPRLSPTLLQGRLVTLDAMHTQRELCSQVHRFGGHYVLVAKENQLGLLADIADLFEDPTPDRRRWREAETWDKGHGR
jgi:hypothetical protein